MQKIYTEVTRCRICGNENMVPIIQLGNQFLTGIFPKTKEQDVSRGPLELIKCDDRNNRYCGLLQLRYSYEPSFLYGEGYGYRSSLNQLMVGHLKCTVKKIVDKGILRAGDIVVDIGSNDGTLLKCYPSEGLNLLGIDPIGKSFQPYYPSHIQFVPEFFSSKIYKSMYGSRKAKVITSIAMFYDLEDPLDFVRQVHDILDDQGIWLLEQSYMPTMIEQTSYDTICHEHVGYYMLKQIQWMAQCVGFNIIDVEFNDANGGSFLVMLSKGLSPGKKEAELISAVLNNERSKGFSTLAVYEDFKKCVFSHRDELCQSIDDIKKSGKKLLGYGASTKGNVILQFCGLTQRDIPSIAEVNPDKFGAYTPGSLIPIISESEAHRLKPDYLLVFPWHFKKNILVREQAYIDAGGKLLFPFN